MKQRRSRNEDERRRGTRRLVLRSKSSRVYPVRNDTGQAKPLRETRKYNNALRLLCELSGRCGEATPNIEG